MELQCKKMYGILPGSRTKWDVAIAWNCDFELQIFMQNINKCSHEYYLEVVLSQKCTMLQYFFHL